MSSESAMLSNHLILCHPLLLWPSIFPSIRVFSSDPLFETSGQSIGASTSSVLPMNIQGLTGLISLQFKGLSRVFSSTTNQKNELFGAQNFLVQISHSYMTTGKTIALTIQTFVSKVISLIFNMLCRFIIAFLPRSKHLLISWPRSPSAVILEPKKIVNRWIWKQGLGNDFDGFVEQQNGFNPLDCLLVSRRKLVRI